MRVKHSHPRPPIRVTADGKGLVSHSGARMLADVAEECGLQDDLSVALSPLVRRQRRHDPGRVLVDLAVMAADGGGYSSDLAPLRDQPALFGPVASQPTAWRLLDAIDADIDLSIHHCPGRRPEPGCGRRAWHRMRSPWISMPP